MKVKLPRVRTCFDFTCSDYMIAIGRGRKGREGKGRVGKRREEEERKEGKRRREEERRAGKGKDFGSANGPSEEQYIHLLFAAASNSTAWCASVCSFSR